MTKKREKAVTKEMFTDKLVSDVWFISNEEIDKIRENLLYQWGAGQSLEVIHEQVEDFLNRLYKRKIVVNSA